VVDAEMGRGSAPQFECPVPDVAEDAKDRVLVLVANSPWSVAAVWSAGYWRK